MSASASAKHTWRGLGLDVVSLAVLVGILFGATHVAPDSFALPYGSSRGVASLVGALGFLLLAGTLMSQLVEVARVPHLTGYLVAGILAGPHVLHLIDHDTVRRLEPVNTLALALIALAGGCELKLDALRRELKGLLVSTAVQSVMGVVLVGLVFLVVGPLMIPFVQGMPFASVFAVALLWGVLAISRSPSAALGVLSQTRAAGPLARYTLAFIMTSDVVVVVMLAGALVAAKPLIEPGATLSFAAMRTLGHELLGSISMGTTLGLLLAAYLRLSGRQLLVVLIAIGFGASEVLRYLQFDPLLTFLVAGFVVQNLSKQGDRFIHAIEETGGVVYVIFFASAGAHLNLPLLRDLWPVALILTGSRAAVAFVSGRIASAMANDPPMVKKWGWAPLVSQAGFALGLAQTAAREFPSFGAGFRDLAIATIAINEMFGPILFKFALDRAGETKGPAPSLADIDGAEAKDRLTGEPEAAKAHPPS